MQDQSKVAKSKASHKRQTKSPDCKFASTGEVKKGPCCKQKLDVFAAYVDTDPTLVTGYVGSGPLFFQPALTETSNSDTAATNGVVVPGTTSPSDLALWQSQSFYAQGCETLFQPSASDQDDFVTVRTTASTDIVGGSYGPAGLSVPGKATAKAAPLKGKKGGWAGGVTPLPDNITIYEPAAKSLKQLNSLDKKVAGGNKSHAAGALSVLTRLIWTGSWVALAGGALVWVSWQVGRTVVSGATPADADSNFM